MSDTTDKQCHEFYLKCHAPGVSEHEFWESAKQALAAMRQYNTDMERFHAEHGSDFRKQSKAVRALAPASPFSDPSVQTFMTKYSGGFTMSADGLTDPTGTTFTWANVVDAALRLSQR